MYIAMDCIMCYEFSLHVFNRWVHKHAQSITRIHSFLFTLTRCKLMFSHDQILINPKGYGLVQDVYVKKICVCCTVFAEALFLNPSSYRCINCSFPNNLKVPWHATLWML